MQIRFDRVHPIVLKSASANLVPEPDSAAFLVKINDHSGFRSHYPLERLLQLLAAIASRRREHVASQALRMEPHQHRPSTADLALEQRKMLAAIDDILEDHRPQHAAANRKRLLGN